MKKSCTSCEKEKPVEQFSKHKAGRMGRHSWCKACFAERSKLYRRRFSTPEKKRIHNLMARYKMTPEQFDAILLKQAGNCAICFAPLTMPRIDHCHRTGRVRGILCPGCNLRLPIIEDREVLASAIAYLTRSEREVTNGGG